MAQGAVIDTLGPPLFPRGGTFSELPLASLLATR